MSEKTARKMFQAVRRPRSWNGLLSAMYAWMMMTMIMMLELCGIMFLRWWLAKYHGYDGHIRAKILAGCGNKFGRKPNFAESGLFWEDLHNLSEMSVHKLAQFDLSCQHLLSKSILFFSFIQLHNLKVFVHVKGFHNSVCPIKMQGIYFWKRSAGQQMINVQSYSQKWHGKFHTQIFYNGKREKSPTW